MPFGVNREAHTGYKLSKEGYERS